ncbi:MAG: hypothetical protein JW946_01285, partial [Candidatus Omnitrophica bacterium]|nr:hypothetical protein [Candidatus Omnitrophota bacterium]
MKKHLFFIIFFAAIVFIFLGKIIFMKEFFILGDYSLQHYPWSEAYSAAIKHFHFPFWCRYFHSGFPLMAEGQIGGFYPLNIIMFFVLPFKLAYNYSVVLHFVIAGIFAYAYTRKLGAEKWGASLSALLFCFASAYAGCFNNIATLRTLSWFPLVLLLIEYFLDTRRLHYIFIASLICGMQFLAGFMQMAIYSFAFYMIYLLYQFRLRSFSIKERIRPIIAFLMISFIVALPQVLLSVPLAQASNRTGASLGFALWKSFPLPCFLSAFFPSWLGIFAQQTYIGILSILFLIYVFVDFKRSRQIRPVVLIVAIAIFLALGKYNPLYAWFLDLIKLYSFRNPSRFLFFAMFGCSVLAGLGFSKFFQDKNEKQARLASRLFVILLAAVSGIYVMVKTMLVLFEKNIILLLHDYTAKHIFNTPY